MELKFAIRPMVRPLFGIVEVAKSYLVLSFKRVAVSNKTIDGKQGLSASHLRHLLRLKLFLPVHEVDLDAPCLALHDQ